MNGGLRVRAHSSRIRNDLRRLCVVPSNTLFPRTRRTFDISKPKTTMSSANSTRTPPCSTTTTPCVAARRRPNAAPARRPLRSQAASSHTAGGHRAPDALTVSRVQHTATVSAGRIGRCVSGRGGASLEGRRQSRVAPLRMRLLQLTDCCSQTDNRPNPGHARQHRTQTTCSSQKPPPASSAVQKTWVPESLPDHG